MVRRKFRKLPTPVFCQPEKEDYKCSENVLCTRCNLCIAHCECGPPQRQKKRKSELPPPAENLELGIPNPNVRIEDETAFPFPALTEQLNRRKIDKISSEIL